MKRKRTRRGKIKLTIFTLLLLFIIGFIGTNIWGKIKFNNELKSKYENIVKPTSNNKSIGKIKSNIKYGKDAVIATHYPQLNIRKLDKNSENIIDDYVKKFNKSIKENNKNNNQKDINNIPDLTIDYNIFKFTDDVVSIKFDIDENIPKLGETKKYIETVVYDLSDETIIEFNDLFIEEGIKDIVELNIKSLEEDEDIKDELNNADVINKLNDTEHFYNNFILYTDHIEFLFSENDIFSDLNRPIISNVFFEDIEEYITFDLDTLEALNDDTIKEKREEAIIKSANKRTLDPEKPAVALTFDDGPYESITIPILDTLKEYDSTATFFVLGNRVGQNEDIIKRIVEDGSEIGNHSFNHKQLTTISDEELANQLNYTQNEVKKVTGKEPTLLRPTYGAINDNLKSKANMPLILWNIDTLDWKDKNSDRITNHILNNVKDGDIILMHDMYETTRIATQNVIPELVNRGFQLVTISELYDLKNIPLENGERYTNIDPLE